MNNKNGVVVHLDNDIDQVLKPAEQFFVDANFPMTYIPASTIEEFEAVIEREYSNLKVIIIDLIEKDTKEELENPKSSAFYSSISKAFRNINVPIFIYSGHLENFHEFNYNGTVIKIDKGNEKGFKAVTDKIQLLQESGFLEVFCPKGIVESLLMKDLHEAFTRQFLQASEIESIIHSIKEAGVDLQTRTKEIFSRIAVRSLLSRLMIDKTIEDQTFDEAIISAIELYVRRLNIEKTPIWTGDIFKSVATDRKIIVLTPRCDLASKGKETILICDIIQAEDYNKKNALAYIRDNIKDKKFRYLPSTPLFKGGKVDLSLQSIITKESLKADYQYVISLTDDLTNEILAKFCSYLLRTSIPDVVEKELQSLLNAAADGN